MKTINLPSPAVELIIGALTVAASAGATYATVTGLEHRITRVEHQQEKMSDSVSDTLKDLSLSISSLNEVLAGMKVELTYIKEDIKVIKGGSYGQ